MPERSQRQAIQAGTVGQNPVLDLVELGAKFDQPGFHDLDITALQLRQGGGGAFQFEPRNDRIVHPFNRPDRLAAGGEQHARVEPERHPPRLQRLVLEILFQVRQHARRMIGRQRDLDAALAPQQEGARGVGQLRKIAQKAARAMIAEAQMQPDPVRALIQCLRQGLVVNQLAAAAPEHEAERQARRNSANSAYPVARH